MSQADYEIYLSDHTGRAFRKNITGAILNLDATRVVNGIGQCQLELDPKLLDESYFRRDARLAIYRALPGRPPALLFNTVYLLRRYMDHYTRATKTRKLQAYDLNHLIGRRIIAYYAGSANAKKSAAIDDMIKAYARENLGATATDTTRRWDSAITIAADLTAAPTTSKSAAWRPLMQTIQELAQASAEAGTYLAVDLSALTESSFYLATYTGQRGIDRRQGSGNQFVLSLLRGNFDNVDIDHDWSGEITRVHAGAQGVESERNVQQAESAYSGASMFNLIEAFTDVRHLDQTDTTGAQDEAEARLREYRPRLKISGDLIETDGSIYDVHVSWGDYVSINVETIQADCRLDIARLRLGRQGAGFEERMEIAAIAEGSADV